MYNKDNKQINKKTVKNIAFLIKKNSGPPCGIIFSENSEKISSH